MAFGRNDRGAAVAADDRGAAVAARQQHVRGERERPLGDSRAAGTDPESLAREIERTRGELARTVDAIADRVSPSHAARRAVTRAQEQAARIDPTVAAAVAAALAVGVTAYLFWRRRRR